MSRRSSITVPRAGLIAAVAWLAWALVGAAPDGPAEADRAVRLQAIQQEISRLERELTALRERERGVLGELERLRGELRLREKQVEEVVLRSEAIEAEIEGHDRKLADTEQGQTRRVRYLTRRLREMYRMGPDHALEQFLGGDSVERYWVGLRYATFLSETDARVVREYRSASVRIGEQRQALDETHKDLEATRGELESARASLEQGQRRQARSLRALREDQSKRKAAIDELREAADGLGRVVETLPDRAAPTLDVRKFRGLLDWPAPGKVSAGFGSVVHPRFKTRVPHPGLDIEGEWGSRVRSVFDGRVVFASWMRGYGLTAIVDHGGGTLSIYAHASALVVETGDELLRGQLVGMIGDTGSLRGPYLYFELRVDGKPTDPVGWLRPR